MEHGDLKKLEYEGTLCSKCECKKRRETYEKKVYSSYGLAKLYGVGQRNAFRKTHNERQAYFCGG
jgi:hypothetical protein